MHLSRALLSFAVPVLFAALYAPSVGATVVVVPPLEEMAVASDVIFEAVVGEARVIVEESSSGKRVVTYTTLDVKDGWKGAKAGDQVQLFQLGGNLDGKSSWIVGAHRFERGQRIVFFGVKSKTRDAVVPYGIGFGVFSVEEQLTGEKVIEIVGDVVVLDKGAASKAPGQRRYDTLASFKAMVLRAMELQEQPKMQLKTKLIPKQKGG